MKKKVAIIVAVGVVFILFVICLITIFTRDREAPIITFYNDEITYSEGDDVELLLAGVDAYDKVDGDVTSTITIESIHVLSDGEKVSINYAARDTMNNVVKKERTIPYIQREVLSEITTKSEAATEESTTEGPVDNIEETETEEPLVSTGDPVIRLNTNEVTISAGSFFNGMSYIEDAVDDQDYVWTRVRIDGNYNTNVPGQYTLQYYATDLQGNQSNVETLVLTVE